MEENDGIESKNSGEPIWSGIGRYNGCADSLEDLLPKIDDGLFELAKEWKDKRGFNFVGSGMDYGNVWFSYAKILDNKFNLFSPFVTVNTRSGRESHIHSHQKSFRSVNQLVFGLFIHYNK